MSVRPSQLQQVHLGRRHLARLSIGSREPWSRQLRGLSWQYSDAATSVNEFLGRLALAKGQTLAHGADAGKHRAVHRRILCRDQLGYVPSVPGDSDSPASLNKVE